MKVNIVPITQDPDSRMHNIGVSLLAEGLIHLLGVKETELVIQQRVNSKEDLVANLLPGVTVGLIAGEYGIKRVKADHVKHFPPKYFVFILSIPFYGDDRTMYKIGEPEVKDISLAILKALLEFLDVQELLNL
jgi:hypothetical protein